MIDVVEHINIKRIYIIIKEKNVAKGHRISVIFVIEALRKNNNCKDILVFIVIFEIQKYVNK